MNVALEIKKIQKDLKSVKDENIVNAIKSLLEKSKKQQIESIFAPLSIDEYKNRAEQSQLDIEKGRFVNVDTI